MQTLIELIERHSDENSDFRYYVPIIEKAERNEIEHPDITIECCASLFQGISKTIVYRLNPPTDKKQFENESIQRQVKAAFRCLEASDDAIELAFPVAVENMVRIVGELRNTRGDISHGRVVPKELQSDRSLARLVLNVSESVIRYMLASYFAIKPAGLPDVDYYANAGFNEYLDEINPMEGKPLYSLALYQQYYEDYLIQLSLFVESENENNEDDGE